MGNFTEAELNRAAKPRGLTGASALPGRMSHPIDEDLRYINELERVLVAKIGPFFQDLISGPTCVLELK